MVKLLWPTEYSRITQPFGANPQYYNQYGLPGHEGIDFMAPHGSKIFACADGVVKLAVDNENAGGNYGIQVRITHEGGKYETIYAHLESVRVRQGEQVRQGDVIGLADETGNSRGSHLHLTMKDYTVDGYKNYPNNITDPTPFLMKYGEPPMRNLACGNVIQVGYSDDEIMAVVNKLRPEFMVVTSRPALAAQMVAAGVKVIYRRWPDDGPSFNGNPVAFVDFVAAEAPKGALLSLPNEPGTITPKFAADTLVALQRATEIGRTAVFGNFATGNPEPEQWELMRSAIEYAYNHGHILGLHEYWSPDPFKDYQYHVGRFLNVYEIFGNRVPRIVMTEIGYAKNYDPYQGWQGNISESIMAGHIRQVHGLYKKYNIAYCVFSFGNWPNNTPDNGSFDVMTSQIIMDTLYDFLGDVPMTIPLPPNTPVYNGKVTKLPGTNTYQNIRSGPSASTADIGDLKVGDLINYAEPIEYPGWYWLRLGTLEGWTAKTVGGSPLVIERIGEPEPYDPLADLKKLRGDLDAIIGRLE